MGALSQLSIKHKIFASSLVVLISLVAIGWGSISGLSAVQGNVDTMVGEAVPTALHSYQVSESVRTTVASLGFHLLSKEANDAEAFRSGLETTGNLISELQNSAAIARDSQSQDLLKQVQADLDTLNGMAPKLLKLTENDANNILAIAFANEHANPVFREKLARLSTIIETELAFEPEIEDTEITLPSPVPAVSSVEDLDSEAFNQAIQPQTQTVPNTAQALNDLLSRRELLAAAIQLRYYWMTLNNEMRLFLAFRVPLAVENIKTFQSAIDGEVEKLEAQRDLFEFEQEEAFDAFIEGLQPYWDTLDELVQIHSADDWRQDSHLIRTEISPMVARMSGNLKQLAERQQQQINAAAQHTNEIYTGSRTTTIATLVIVISLIGGFAWWLARSITQPLGRAVAVADNIAQGNLENDINSEASDETGQLMQSLKTMQHDLRQRIEADAKVAAENLRVRRALDNVASAVTVSNDQNELIYHNREAKALFDDMQSDWQESHPDFVADSLIGNKLSSYFPAGEFKQTYMAELKSERTLDGVLAGRNMRLIASPVYDDEGTYQGRVTQWIDRTQELLEAELEQQRLLKEREIAAVNQRIRTSLDKVSSNVMLADPEGKIIYLNNSAQDLFDEAESDLRQDLPDFESKQLLGSNIDDFHKSPPHQQQLLSNLQHTHTAEVYVGGRTMQIIANPVNDEDGSRLGTAVEWVDRTDEVAIEREIDQVVEAAVAGDLDSRLDMQGKQGFFLQLSTGVNNLLEQLQGVFGDLSRSLEALSQGELEQRIDKEYRGTFGVARDNMNNTLDNLQGIVQELYQASNRMGQTSHEINAGNMNLSVRTEQQASALQETASSMEEFTSTVSNTADNSQKANQVAAEARSKAEQGGEVVGKAIDAMQQINESSTRIAEIIGVIDEIAFQTNLLALNASVEAARAGEQGRGFAVVATEVRNLASRSADAAREIKELINDSVSKVEAGSELVNHSGETLNTIVDSVKQVNDIIAEIAAASEEQRLGISQVNEAITSMDELTQQNAALAEQTSAASRDMSENANQMLQQMGFFALARGGAMSLGTTTTSPSAQTASPAAAPMTASVAAIVEDSLPATNSADSSDSSGDDEWEEF